MLLLIFFRRVIFLISIYSFAQPKSQYQTVTIAFYNVENLFDTINSVDRVDGFRHPENIGYHISIPYSKAPDSLIQNPWKNSLYRLRDNIRYIDTQDQEYTPESSKHYNQEKYQTKLDHISEIINEIGPLGDSPVIVGLCEIENGRVLNDLINHPNLKESNYGIIHFNSFDHRGIDVALLYKKDRFIPITKERHAVFYNNKGKTYKRKTRDQLWVNGLLDGESIHFIINHWPSRRRGISASENYRIEAAQTTLKIVEKIKTYESQPKIVIMGDFNDNPTNKSIQMLMEYNKTPSVTFHFKNTLKNHFKKGLGTLVWKDVWHLFDQFLVSTPLFKNSSTMGSYFYVNSGIYSPKKIKTSTGRFKGYPSRTYVGNVYKGGYSDHFPIYLLLAKEISP